MPSHIRPRPFPSLVVLALLVLLAPTAGTSGALSAQTIRGVSTGMVELVSGGAAVNLRIEGRGLSGVTEARFTRNGRAIRGIEAKLRASDRAVEIRLAADRGLSSMDGIALEVGGAKMRSMLKVPVEMMVVAEKWAKAVDSGTSPPSDPPASDPSVQVAEVRFDEDWVYAGGKIQGRVTLTTTSSEPVQVEVVSERPSSLQAPGTVVVPAGQLEATFEVEGIEPYIYFGDPWIIEVEARKPPATSGPHWNVRVTDAPAPDLALFPNDGAQLYDWGNTSYAPAPDAEPARPGDTRDLRIRLTSEPVLGGTLQLSATGPIQVPSSVSIPAGDDRVVAVPATFGSVSGVTIATVTVSGYGRQVQESIEIRPDQVFAATVQLEGGSSWSASTTVSAGNTVRLEIGLSQPAGPGGVTVPVQASDPSTVGWTPLTIPAGSDAGVLIIGTAPTDSTRTVTLTIGEFDPHTFEITVNPAEMER